MMQKLDFVDAFRACVAGNDASIERIAKSAFQEHDSADMFVPATGRKLSNPPIFRGRQK
jgi:hypothetical protein